MYGQMLGQPPGPQVGPPPPGAPGPMGAPPPAAALGLGMGAPPNMPGLPPPPTMTGGIPTGDPSTTKKEAADNAVLSLRELKGHYPALAQAIDPMIDQIKSAAKAPGASAPSVPPVDPLASGTKGGF